MMIVSVILTIAVCIALRYHNLSRQTKIKNLRDDMMFRAVFVEYEEKLRNEDINHEEFFDIMLAELEYGQVDIVNHDTLLTIATKKGYIDIVKNLVITHKANVKN